MAEQIRVRVPAKVNLALRVGPPDDEGYHALGTIFQAVSLFDDVTVEATEAGVFELQITGRGEGELATDDRNLAIKAAKLLANRYQVTTGVKIKLHKRIPIAGGMAGGSADAAGVLLACSVLWDLDTSPDDLVNLAAELGSDVPFAVFGGVAIGTGRGDRLVPILTRGTLHWVFATSSIGLS
ncbi:MAG: 4-(cytidine 5'-diphospho)-2-C-methyl-D-erythritol kinase, partial [Propionibacterium sp.]